MAQQIAEFWSSRVRFNYTGSEQYDIPGKRGAPFNSNRRCSNSVCVSVCFRFLLYVSAVMGPDEDHENVTNNAYTNVVAGYALYFGE